MSALEGFEKQIQSLQDAGNLFWQRGWSVGTSSNYSIVLQQDPLELLVTASGKDKGRLQNGDFVRVAADGRPVLPDQPKSSAETLLHVLAASWPNVGAILHTHSVWSTLLSDHYAQQGGWEIAGYEMLKGLAGIGTHETSVFIPVFENTQDIAALSEQVAAWRSVHAEQPFHAYLIRKHGLYTWGADIEEARRHIEILEFLFECEFRKVSLSAAASQRKLTADTDGKQRPVAKFTPVT